MDIAFNGGKICGTVTAPPSKSCTHRALLLASLSGGRCVLNNPLISKDTMSTIEAIRCFGASITLNDGCITVESNGLHAPEEVINAGNSGTTLRMMAGVSALFPHKTVLSGDESLCRRPMQPLLDTFETCGASCGSTEGHAPITVKGPIEKDILTVDGTMSSQFISSVLMVSPMIGRRMTVEIEGDAVSGPYIDMTVQMMRYFGASLRKTDSGYVVDPVKYRPTDLDIPGDWSSSAFILAAGGLSGEVTVLGLNSNIPQGDARIIDILKDAGCRIDQKDGSVRCESSGRLKSADVDVSSTPDLFPIVAVMMSVAEGKSRLYGASHLRYKETDRIASTVSMLKTLGADIEATEDGCIINGTDRLRGGRIEHGGDHRVMMAAAVASLVSEGPVSMEDDGCWNVSYPRFINSVRSLGMRC